MFAKVVLETFSATVYHSASVYEDCEIYILLILMEDVMSLF